MPYYFHPDEVEAGRQIMTEFIAEVSAMVRRGAGALISSNEHHPARAPPRHGRRAVAEKVSGSQLWPRAGSLPLPLGVSGAGADALPDGVDAVTFDVTSGSYEFSAQ